MRKRKSQKQQIAEYLRKHGYINCIKAARIYILNVRNRIGEMEEKGWRFKRIKRNRKGSSPYTDYILVSEPKRAA